MDNELFDIAIVGCGPACLSAALCAKLRNRKIILLGSGYCSRKVDQAPSIDNYLGIQNVPGKELRQRFLDHVTGSGITITESRVNNIFPGEGTFSLISNDEAFEAKSVILAMGVSRTATLPGEDSYLGRGVSYCATCDGPLYKGKTVAVVSGIPEGEEEADFLAELCGKVYYIPQYKEVGKLSSTIEVLKGRPKGIEGDTQARKLILDTKTLDVDGIFMIYDAAPAEQMVPGLEMDEGHVKVDRRMHTNLPGIFAAGDCSGKPYQIAKAVGEGQVAALEAVSYLASKTQSQE